MLDAGCWMLGPFVVQASRLHDSTTVEEVRARRPHHNIVLAPAVAVHPVGGDGKSPCHTDSAMDDNQQRPERPTDNPFDQIRAARQRKGLQLFGIPLRVEPFFFVTAWLIGPRQEPLWSLVWVLVVLTGILAHELGHAFAGRRLGLQPWMQLMAFGGMTGWIRPRPLTAGQQILISAAGPAVGISIGGAVLVASFAGVFAGAPPAVLQVLDYVLWVNLGWGILNLLPILPLDGGHILSSVAGLVAGRNGRIAARIFSIVLTVVIGLWALVAGQWWIAILGVVLTIANVQGFRAEMAQAH